jgi:hypothetical protein
MDWRSRSDGGIGDASGTRIGEVLFDQGAQA